MENNRLIAYLLIGIGVLFLLAQVSFGSGWLWVGLVALAFLVGYSRQKSYGLLVTGCILAGLAVGLLIGSWPGLFISLGIGFLAIDRVEPRSARWPLIFAAGFAGMGFLGWLLDSGVFGSILFALVLVGGGLYLLMRGQREAPKAEAPAPAAPAPAAANPAAESVASQPAVPPDVAAKEPAQTPASSQPLLEKLEAWRRETAKAEDRAAYLILTNESLQQIAEARPQTLEDLKRIKGIGPVKLERYGQEILALVGSS